jgi:hypothetical protein
MTCFDLEDFRGEGGGRLKSAGDYENKKSLGTFFKHNVPLTRKSGRFGKMGMNFLGTLCKAVGHTKKICLKSPYFSPTDYFSYIVFGILKVLAE